MGTLALPGSRGRIRCGLCRCRPTGRRGPDLSKVDDVRLQQAGDLKARRQDDTPEAIGRP